MVRTRLLPALTLAFGLGAGTLFGLMPAHASAVSSASAADFLSYARRIYPLLAPCNDGATRVERDEVALVHAMKQGRFTTGRLSNDANDAAVACYTSMTKMEGMSVPLSLRGIPALAHMVNDTEKGYASYALAANDIATAADDINKQDYTKAGKLLTEGGSYFSGGARLFQNALHEMNDTAHTLHIPGY